MESKNSEMKKALQASFLNLLKNRKYDTISIQEIANGAFTTRANFYYYYSSKEDIIKSILFEIETNYKVSAFKRAESISALPHFSDHLLRPILYPTIYENINILKEHLLLYFIRVGSKNFDFLHTLQDIFFQALVVAIPERISIKYKKDFIEISCNFVALGTMGVLKKYIVNSDEDLTKLIAEVCYHRIAAFLIELQDKTK